MMKPLYTKDATHWEVTVSRCIFAYPLQEHHWPGKDEGYRLQSQVSGEIYKLKGAAKDEPEIRSFANNRDIYPQYMYIIDDPEQTPPPCKVYVVFYKT